MESSRPVQRRLTRKGAEDTESWMGRRGSQDQVGASLLGVDGRPFVLGPLAPERIDCQLVEPLPVIEGRKPLPLQVRRHGDENRKVQHGPYASMHGEAAIEQDDRSPR